MSAKTTPESAARSWLSFVALAAGGVALLPTIGTIPFIAMMAFGLYLDTPGDGKKSKFGFDFIGASQSQFTVGGASASYTEQTGWSWASRPKVIREPRFQNMIKYLSDPSSGFGLDKSGHPVLELR